MLMMKLASQLIYPLNLSIVAIAAGALLCSRKRTRWGVASIAAALGWLWLWSMPICSDAISGRLERVYLPKPVAEMENADVIVLLGGAVEGVAPPRTHANLLAAGDRVLHAARLFKAGKAPYVLASGGEVFKGSEGPEAPALAGLLVEFGVPKSAILEESESRNTYQNAAFSKKIMDARGFKKALLVTSALHMRRALATFRAQGIEVVPAPTDYEVVRGRARTILDWLPAASALEHSTRAFKEVVGGWAYSFLR